jgi:hypothetical protein
VDSSIALTQIGSSAFTVLVIQWIKSLSWFPWVEKGRRTANLMFSIVAAFLVHAGISYSWNPDTRLFAFVVPTFYGALVGIWHVANQWATQHVIYKATYATKSATSVIGGAAVTAAVEQGK